MKQRPYDALLVIDMQTALVEQHPYQEAAVVRNIGRLLDACRNHRVPVIYVQHDGGAGDGLEHGTEGWTIYSAIAPMEGEILVEKKYNSAFRQTSLREILARLHAENLILCGMQTEYCIDASCKAAFEYGYHVTIAEETTTTFSNGAFSAKGLSLFYEQNIWNGRFASVVPIDSLLAVLTASAANDR